MRTMHRTIVTALIFSKDGKLLMGMKDPRGGGVYPDCWHIPGGGVEEGETQQEALRREMLEEVGMDVQPYNPVLVDDRGRGESTRTLKGTSEMVRAKMQFNVYRIDLDKPAKDIETKPGDDLVILRWIDLADLHAYKITPPSQELFRKLGYMS